MVRCSEKIGITEMAGPLHHRVIATHDTTAGAGYDIKSFTEESVENHVPRYIEVKAVPPSSMKFYWSANERKMAKLLKEFYFLYLLPVLSRGTFDLDGLQIIQDPFLQVYQE